METGFFKAYSNLSQALMRMQNEEGMIANLANYPLGTFSPVFKKYFAGGIDCGMKNCEQFDTSDEAQEIDYQASKNYLIFSKKRVAGSGYFDEGQYILQDGMLIMIENNPGGGQSVLISVDINGINKKPNIWGYDLFTFQVDRNTGKLLPMGSPGTLWTDHNVYCSTESTSRVNGASCAYKAFTEKDYFKNLP